MNGDLPPPWRRMPRTGGGLRRILREDDLDRFLPEATAEQRAGLTDGTFHVEYVTDDDGGNARIELPVMDNDGAVWLWVVFESAPGSPT